MTKEWAQFWIAMTVMMVAASVMLAAANKWSIGSLGEWVSGLGSLAAVVVALWISGRQRRDAAAALVDERMHASAVLEDERRHAAAILEDERKHAAALSEDERRHTFEMAEAARRHTLDMATEAAREVQKKEKAADFHAIGQIMMPLARALTIARSIRIKMASRPEVSQQLAAGFLKLAYITQTTRSLHSVELQKMHTKEGALAIHEANSIWNGVLTKYDLASNEYSTPSQVLSLVDLQDARSDLVSFMHHYLQLADDKPRTKERDAKIAAKAEEMADRALI